MRITRMLALGAAIVVLVGACSSGGSTSAPSAADVTVKVGSDGFYESQLMAEIYAQALEAKGYKIDRTGLGLGTRKVTAAALESGQIDLKPEYIGSGLAFYGGTATGDPAQNEQALQQALTAKGITVLDYSPAADQNAFVVTPETSQKYSLTSLDQVAAISPPLKFGVATDCSTNPVCAQALKDAYGIDVSNALPLSACDQPMVDAIKAGTIDVGELCSTQPDIAQNGWVVLADPKHTQPADNIAPLVRDDLLAKVDKSAFETILNGVSAKMTTDELTKLNAEYVFDKKDISTIAKEWLSQNPV
jgi:osmoprotectant transport system substrate-binding protein